METVRGIVDHNTIRLVTPLPFPEGSEIEFEPRVVHGPKKSSPEASADAGDPPSGIGSNSDKLYELLDARYNSGFSDTAARHNEHQP